MRKGKVYALGSFSPSAQYAQVNSKGKEIPLLPNEFLDCAVQRIPHENLALHPPARTRKFVKRAEEIPVTRVSTCFCAYLPRECATPYYAYPNLGEVKLDTQVKDVQVRSQFRHARTGQRAVARDQYQGIDHE
jgi:hypothetical protein